MLTTAAELAFQAIALVAETFPTITTAAATLAATLTVQKAYRAYQHWNTKEIKRRLTDTLVKALQKAPIVGPKVREWVDMEVNGVLSGVKKEVDEARAGIEPIPVLPEDGLSEEVIRQRLAGLQTHYKPGTLSGAVYAEYDEKLSALLQYVWSKTALTNPLHSEWPLINLMEAEVISMCQQLLHGEQGAPGMMTHGGSTSILEACKAYVLYARANGNNDPEIIVPESVHVAFDKAAKLLNARLIKVPVDPKLGTADVRAMERAITSRTCLIVGSAPSFPSGVMDPIQDLAAVAKKHCLPCHVDSCLGGFLTVFAKEAGFSIPPCDFSVDGVTSVSIDTHKYGQTPKGTSVLLFKRGCSATPTHAHLDWVGGMYVTPGIDGSRSGADIATAWAVLCYKGRKEYVKETAAILSLQRDLVEQLRKIEGVCIPYDPKLSVIPIQTAKGINSLLVADRLKSAGWSVSILQTPDQRPDGFHFCLTAVHAHQSDFAKRFIQALSEAVQYAKTHPKEVPGGMAKAYGKLANGVPRCVQEQLARGYMQLLSTLHNRVSGSLWSSSPPAATVIADNQPAVTLRHTK